MARRLPKGRIRLNPNVVWAQLNRRNMTQNELARAAGITTGYLSQLMGGTRSPSPPVQTRLMEELGIEDPEALFTQDGESGGEADTSEPASL